MIERRGKNMSYSLENRELKELIKKLYFFHESYSNSSIDEKIRNAKPADLIPQKGIIYGEFYRQKFNEEATRLYGKAMSIVDKELQKIQKLKAAAPSQDAVNVLQITNMRTDLTLEELDNLYAVYGSNYQVAKILRNIAIKNKLERSIFRENRFELDDHEEQVKFLKESIEKKFNLGAIEAGRAKDTVIAIFSIGVDNAFPL